MKRKGLVARLAVLAVVLCLVTMSLTAGTLAKYASEFDGTATATVAKWAVAFKDGDGNAFSDTNTLTLNLKDTAKETAKLVKADRIAPGTTGSFALAVDGTGTEVAFSYTIELDMSAADLQKAPIKFYSNEACTTPLTVTGNKVTLTGNVLTDGTVSNKETIYWKWDSTAYDAETNEDIRDTKVGEASAAAAGGGGLVYEIPVTIHAEQLLTAPASGA